jgi:hypothetical protein
MAQVGTAPASSDPDEYFRIDRFKFLFESRHEFVALFERQSMIHMQQRRVIEPVELFIEQVDVTREGTFGIADPVDRSPRLDLGTAARRSCANCGCPPLIPVLPGSRSG